MQHHIWGVREEWDTAESMMLLTIDYRNAFPTLSHNFIRAALTFFSFPPTFVNLAISSLKSHYHFLVGSAAIKEATFCQEAGIGQGDPFSPQLFSAQLIAGSQCLLLSASTTDNCTYQHEMYIDTGAPQPRRGHAVFSYDCEHLD